LGTTSECKAYRDKNIDANILKNLAGTLVFKEYDEAWLISTAEFGKEAKGFVKEWKEKPGEKATSLSFYDPEKVIKSLINSGTIKSPPLNDAIDVLGSENLLGDWVLVITPYGDFWLAATLSGGIPKGALCYYANNNERVEDVELLERLIATDTSLNELDFTLHLTASKPLSSITTEDFIGVVEVQTGDEWTDYRPARPQDFVGRTKDLNCLFDLFKSIQTRESTTRVFALTGDSGMGKSSLIAKLVNKSRNKHNKNKFFLYAVDLRAAISPAYIYSSLLECFKTAQKSGFGDKSIDLTLTNVSSPLSSDSIKSYLESLEADNKVVVLIFDQFEELYSKPELLDVFNHAKSLLLNAAAVKASFCLGFAWKSDSTTHSEHPAYFFWHELSDYRLTRKLSPFSDYESKAVINKFEQELGTKLHNDLKHNLVVSSQGYPWLLKKLCIHLYEKINAGIQQNELIENKLDVRSLFDSDLEQLSQGERTCLDFIAKRAPVDWFEVIELSGADTLNALIHRRLVVRSGDRLNIYWDIFREYILTNRVPIIPLRYLPSTDFTSVQKLVSKLTHDHPVSIQDLVKMSGLSEGTVQNIGSDIDMFGIITRESGEYVLSKDIATNNELEVLRVIRVKFNKHAFTLALKDRASSSVITLKDAIAVLQGLYPASSYADKTWHSYTVRMCRWLELCGFLVQADRGWLYRDQGDVVSERVRSIRRLRRGKLFTAPASPALTVEALSWLIEQQSVIKKSNKPKGYRNALSILIRFGLATQDAERLYPNTSKISKFSSLEESIWIEASSESVLIEVQKILDQQLNVSAVQIGEHISNKYQLDWTQASKIRNGGGIRQWALWIYEGKKYSQIPKSPGRT